MSRRVVCASAVVWTTQPMTTTKKLLLHRKNPQERLPRALDAVKGTDSLRTKPPQAHVERRATLGQGRPRSCLRWTSAARFLRAHAAGSVDSQLHCRLSSLRARHASQTGRLVRHHHAQDPLLHPSSPARSNVRKPRRTKWRSRLAKQASWWDSAAVAIKQTATMADIHMGEASRAYRKSDSSLRNLMRGRNHAAADMKGVEKWKDQAIDEFVGRDPAVREAEPPPPHIVPSPNHFDRLYGVPRKPLPSLRLEARTRLNADSQASQAREVATLEARSKAFGKRRMGS